MKPAREVAKHSGSAHHMQSQVRHRHECGCFFFRHVPQNLNSKSKFFSTLNIAILKLSRSAILH